MSLKKLIKCMLSPIVYALTYLEIPFRHYRINISRKEAVTVITEIMPRHKFSITTHNDLLTPPQYDLMVIVPVYNVAPYLTACIESMLTQRTTYTYHIVIVDDGSTDESSSILQHYETNDSITIISKENGGLSSARNAALRYICGKYIMFVDSDDIVAPNAFETMLSTAYRWDADAVEGSVEVFNGNDTVQVQQRKQSTNANDTTHNLRGEAWAKLYRGSLFEDIQFPEGYLFEDSILTYCIHPRIKHAYTVSDVVYRYRLNPHGITFTSKKRPKALDTIWITDYLFPYYMEHYPSISKTEKLTALIYQIIFNYKRTENMEPNVKQAIFAMSCWWFHQYFNRQDADVAFTCWKYKMLCLSLETHDYGLYRLLCSRWSFLNN